MHICIHARCVHIYLQIYTYKHIYVVGDGANDIPMLTKAGLGIAFNAKPSVQAQAKYRINQPSLSALLYFLGLTDSDIRGILKSL